MTTDEKLKALSAVVAVAGLLWGIYSFIQLQAIGAAKPYLEKKLAWCETAVQTTARIANANPMPPEEIQRFWQMYWGVMGLIEKQPITDAMIAFGKELPPSPPEIGAAASGAPPAGLRLKSLDLAHACRHELSKEWSPQWSFL